MITILYPFMAAGLAFVAAPIIIHLLHRSKVMPYDWGAMMFLEELMAERARKLRMQEILLLLVRALIVACLAFAMMKPAVKSASAGVRSPGSQTSAVVLLDDSYSMNAGRNRTAWHDAREKALLYIDTLRKGDDVSIMFTSNAGKVAAPAVLFDLERAKEIIRKAEPHYDRTDMPRAMTAALQQLEGLHNPRRELVLISDMQAAGWELNDQARWSFIAGAVRSSRMKPNIILASTAEARPSNLSLSNIVPSRAVVDCFSPVSFNITLANEGPEAVNDATVTFIVDHATKATRTVSLLPGAKEVLSFDHKFERSGSHYVACKLRAAGDMLNDDNEIMHSVMVIDKLPVLLVDGDKRELTLGSETDFLRLALSPRDRDDPLWRTVIDSTVVDATDLKYTDFSKYRVIVLANVAALPASVVSEIERFIVAGGGLMITLGDRVQPEAYNRDLFRQGAGLLPVALKKLEGNSALAPARPMLASAPVDGAVKVEIPPVHLANIVSNAPALDLFRPEKGQDWSKARVRSYFSTLAPGDGVSALAAFSNGQPALIQKKLGEGKVLLFTSSADMDWTDMPIHPFYVPLMQNLVFDLASAVIPPRNLSVNQALVHVATGPVALKTHTVLTPEIAAVANAAKPQPPAALKVQRQGALSVFSFENTPKPGLYTVTPEGGAPEDRVFYTVTADRADSQMERLKEEDFERLERDLGAHRAADWNALSKLLQLDAGGYEVSTYLIMAALAFCFIEIYLTRRWA